MNFRFSFSNKSELIYINNTQQIAPIGSLICELAEVNWIALKKEIENCDLSCVGRVEENLLRVKLAVNEHVSHPALRHAIDDISDFNTLIKELKRIELGSKMLSFVLESFIDECQHSYEECLHALLMSDKNSELKHFIDSLGSAKMLTVKERNNPLYYNMNAFPFLFEADDILTVAVQALQFICANGFYVRKCAVCKKYIITGKMNKIYCDRIFQQTGKTCSQIGPVKAWKNNCSNAYALYWTYRRRLYNRATKDNSEYFYQLWINETESYRDKAKRKEIDFEEMKSVLDEIETRVYKHAVLV